MSERRLIEETEEMCRRCGGVGQEERHAAQGSSFMGVTYHTCERCGGSGWLVTKRVYRCEPDEETNY